jgi:hypothetical protein
MGQRLHLGQLLLRRPQLRLALPRLSAGGLLAAGRRRVLLPQQVQLGSLRLQQPLQLQPLLRVVQRRWVDPGARAAVVYETGARD